MSLENVLNKYLVFDLNTQSYAIAIAKVSEIIALKNIEPVGQGPEFLEGTINLRETLIPIINLRKKLGMPFRDYDRNTCIIIIYIKTHKMGIVVDMVFEVAEIKETVKRSILEFGTTTEAQFIESIAKDKEGIKIILDTEHILSKEEFQDVNKYIQV